jgi:hypothetical protein
MQVQAMRQLKESESQLPAVLRQMDRLQRTVNNQEMRLEGVVAGKKEALISGLNNLERI